MEGWRGKVEGVEESGGWKDGKVEGWREGKVEGREGKVEGWREGGGRVEGRWRESGGKVEGEWREGGGVEGRWRGGGKVEGWREGKGRWRDGEKVEGWRGWKEVVHTPQNYLPSIFPPSLHFSTFPLPLHLPKSVPNQSKPI